jgi:excisionase family DNA binding protein
MEELKVYSLEEVTGILQLTKRTLYNYINGNKLKAVKIGKYWRVQHKDLKEFIEQGTN